MHTLVTSFHPLVLAGPFDKFPPHTPHWHNNPYCQLLLVVQTQWKAGKRRAEKDELVGACYLQGVEHPEVSIDVIGA